VSIYNGLLNLTNWTGNVIMPVIAGLFIVVAIVNFSRGREYSHQMYGALLCLLVSGLLRAMETFAGQRAWNDPDVYAVAIRTFVNWTANVLLPVYAALQVAAGALDMTTNVRFHHSAGWMRHFAAAGLCLLVSGLLRLGEFFVIHGTAGIP
jgi:hypothetical protein